MLDPIKHITDDNFFFQKDSAQVHCVTQSSWMKMWLSCFPVLIGSAEAQVISGGIVKRLLIAYFIGNIYAKKDQNPFMCVKVIASQRWDVFWDTVYNVPAQETAKHRAKFGWPPVSDIPAVTKARRVRLLDNSWICQLANCQLTEWTSCGLGNSWTRQLMD